MKKRKQQNKFIFFIQNTGVVLIAILLVPIGIFAVAVGIIWSLIDNIVNILESGIRKKY